MVMTSRSEAFTAIDLHNSPISERPLESFLVHMQLAWLYLLQAEFVKDGVGYHYKNPKSGRYVKIDGERKAWELNQCVKFRWPNNADPVRLNLELTIKLRNKVEHRYERGLMVAAAGFTQSLVMNYERELVSAFGEEYSVADRVHIPVSLSTFSREGVVALVAAQASLPLALRDFFIDYRAGLDESITSDAAFEFRIEIIQKRAPKSDADMAVEFVRLEDLSQEEREAYEALERTGRVILRDKAVEVSNAGWMLPGVAAKVVAEQLGQKFMTSDFVKAWKHFNVRPPTDVPAIERGKTQTLYCRYDPAFGNYIYSQNFVDLVTETCSEASGYEEITGREPE
jgi:hypothetical protein